MKQENPGADRAIIIGAGMAGLLAARVLSEHFAAVEVIERDHLPQEPANRPGTPQAYHPHRLIPSGRVQLEQFFPGLTDELLAHGAFLRENRPIHLINHFGAIEVPDEREAGSSRALLEWLIRRRVAKLGNVHFYGGKEVLGLLATGDQGRVTGLYVRERGKTGERQSLLAELVVDASGHTSKVISWLSLLGYPAPETEALNVSLGYSTRYYKVPPNLADPKSTILVEGDPSKGMAIAAFGLIENNLAELVIYRAGGAAYPSTDGDRFEQEVTELISPLVATEVQKLEPLEEPRGFRVMKSLRHHFEQMPRWPQGLLVIGDAMCNFDPIHGQGMTIAAMEAEILGNALAEQRVNPQPKFEVRVLQQMQTALESAWWLTLVADLRWPGVEYKGHQSLQGVAFAQKFFDLYLKEAFGKGNMQRFGIYYMMVALVISPRQIINAETFKSLLANDDSAEAEQLRTEFFPMGGTQAEMEKVEELLDQGLPTFARGVELADMQQPA